MKITKKQESLLKNIAILMRLNNPIGIFLLLIPALMGIFLNNQIFTINHDILIKTIILFSIGAIFMRSAGCIINDLLDVNFDKNVKRTKNRPLASNAISRYQALIILTANLLISLIILLQFNFKTIIAGFAIAGLVAIYPLMKRITYFPQIFLGITFNSPIILSTIALTNSINYLALILYLATILWTLIYDSIYAFQDVEDDLRIGTKSTAIKFYKYPKYILGIIAIIQLALLLSIAPIANFSIGYIIVNLIAIIWLIEIIKRCDFKDPNQCLRSFKENHKIGFLMLLAIIIG